MTEEVLLYTQEFTILTEVNVSKAEYMAGILNIGSLLPENLLFFPFYAIGSIKPSKISFHLVVSLLQPLGAIYICISIGIS